MTQLMAYSIHIFTVFTEYEYSLKVKDLISTQYLILVLRTGHMRIGGID